MRFVVRNQLTRGCDVLDDGRAVAIGNELLFLPSEGRCVPDPMGAQRGMLRRAECDAAAPAALATVASEEEMRNFSPAERLMWGRLIMAPPPRWLIASLWRNGVMSVMRVFTDASEVARYVDAVHASAAPARPRTDDVVELLTSMVNTLSSRDCDSPFPGVCEFSYSVREDVDIVVRYSYEVECMGDVERQLLDPATRLPRAVDDAGALVLVAPFTGVPNCPGCGGFNLSLLFPRTSPAFSMVSDSWRSRSCRCQLCAGCCRIVKLRFCARCRSVGYCSAECQKEDWKRHKGECTATVAGQLAAAVADAATAAGASGSS